MSSNQIVYHNKGVNSSQWSPKLSYLGGHSLQWPHQTVMPRGTSCDKLGKWQLATRCLCCLHYNIIMSSNQIVYHNKYNMYKKYMYKITISIEQLTLSAVLIIKTVFRHTIKVFPQRSHMNRDPSFVCRRVWARSNCSVLYFLWHTIHSKCLPSTWVPSWFFNALFETNPLPHKWHT